MLDSLAKIISHYVVAFGQMYSVYELTVAEDFIKVYVHRALSCVSILKIWVPLFIVLTFF